MLRAFGVLNQVTNRVTQAGSSVFYGMEATDEITKAGLNTRDMGFQDALNKQVFGGGVFGGHEGVRKYLASKGVNTDVLGGFHLRGAVTQAFAKESLAGLEALYELRNMSDPELEAILGKGGRAYVNRASDVMMTKFPEIMKGSINGLHAIDETNEQIDKIMQTSSKLGLSLLDLGEGDKLRNLVSSMETNVKKEEDARLPGHAIDDQHKTAGNTGETAKNTRKANQIQLAILKQIAGTRVINRVVHVNPNIVSNVGTIRNGIEYDQLLKDLGSTVNHAVTAYAL